MEVAHPQGGVAQGIALKVALGVIHHIQRLIHLDQNILQLKVDMITLYLNKEDTELFEKNLKKE